jgi:hypothetical protein
LRRRATDLARAPAARPASIIGRRGDERRLERADQLATLSSLLAGVAGGGRGRLVLVRGEAGVGKTTLVRRFCDDQGSARVLWGACDALFTPRPLGPFVDIAEGAGSGLERVAATSLRPYEFADALIRELGLPGASVVVVEDVHWADEASLDVLRIVARRVELLRALVIATYRDDELERHHPLRTLLGELTGGDMAATRIAVDSLSPEAVAALATEQGLSADDLYRKTSGNPFFVTEVLAAPGADVPDTARDAVLARASRLRPEARVLDAVAVAPAHTEPGSSTRSCPERATARGGRVRDAAGRLSTSPSPRACPPGDESSPRRMPAGRPRAGARGFAEPPAGS